jgi:hypothetical protein
MKPNQITKCFTRPCSCQSGGIINRHPEIGPGVSQRIRSARTAQNQSSIALANIVTKRFEVTLEDYEPSGRISHLDMLDARCRPQRFW